jgi:hypothetical protein
MPGGGCPRGCRALPEQKKNDGGGMWIGSSRNARGSRGIGRRGWCGANARKIEV